MTLAIILALALLPLWVFAFWDKIWGPTGLFWFHREEWQGHMLCHIGTTYDLIVFGFWKSWKVKS